MKKKNEERAKCAFTGYFDFHSKKIPYLRIHVPMHLCTYVFMYVDFSSLMKAERHFKLTSTEPI